MRSRPESPSASKTRFTNTSANSSARSRVRASSIPSAAATSAPNAWRSVRLMAPWSAMHWPTLSTRFVVIANPLLRFIGHDPVEALCAASIFHRRLVSVLCMFPPLRDVNDEADMSDTTGPRIGFLGAGKMATALAQGWTDAGLVSPNRVVAADPLAGARESFAAGRGFRTTAGNIEVVAGSDVLVLAVKPQSMTALLDEIRPAVTPAHLVLSIAAGVTLKQLDHGLRRRRIIPVRPNTPCLGGASASVYSPCEGPTDEYVALREL